MVIPNTTQNGLVLTSLGNGTDASQWASMQTLPPGTATGQMLWWNGSAWTPTATPGSGQYLLWNGTAWVATTPSGGSSVQAYGPVMNGLLAWTFDPALASYTTLSTANLVFFTAIYLQAGVTYTNLWFYTISGGGTTTFGLYNSTTQVAVTASFTFPSAVGANHSVPFTAAYTPTTSGLYWIAVESTGITTVQISASNSGGNQVSLGPNYAQTAGTLKARSSYIASSSLPSTISGTPVLVPQAILFGLT